MTKRLAPLDPKIWAFVVGIAMSVAVGPALGVFSLKAMLQQQGSTPADELYTYCPACPQCGKPGGADGEDDPGPNGGDGGCGGAGDHNEGGGGGSGEGGGAPHPGKGELLFGTTDLQSDGFGQWGHKRVFISNAKFKSSIGSLQSYRWRVEQWTRLELNASRAYAVNGDRWSRSFKKNGDGSYSGDLYYSEKFEYNPTTQQFTLTDTRGGTTIYDITGLFLSYSDPAGNTRSVTYGLFGGIKRPVEMLATFTTNGHTYVESYVYSYALSPTSDWNLATVVLRRSTDGGAFAVVRQVAYTYYQSSGVNGIVNDLELAEIKDGAGAMVETKYYRYTGATLQYVVERRSFARLFADPTINGNLTNLRNASGGTVGIYANLYVETDGTFDNKVTLRKVQGEGCSCGTSGNVGQFTYTYTPRLQVGIDPMNEWTSKMVSTDSANNLTITYENIFGMVMLQSFKNTATGQEWVTYHRYDNKGRRFLTATPTAVLGYSEIYPDLVQGMALVADNSGLVLRRTYGVGEPPYLQDTYVQNGDNGTLVHQTNTQYVKIAGAWQVASVTMYKDDAGTVPVTTSYGYTAVGNEIQSRTTTWPAVDTTENGPGLGSPTSTIQFYDVYRHPTWEKDEDLYIHYNEFDPKTGTLNKMITDVNTAMTSDFFGLPPLWSTQPGAGQHVKETRTIDDLGRPTLITDPLLKKTYFVYNDPQHQMRVYPGWTGTATTGPTEMVRQDWARSYDERLTMSATPTRANGVPTGLEAVSSLQSMARYYLNTADKVSSTDSYFDFVSSGFAYGTNPNVGVQGSNFYRMSFGYDVRGRKDRALGWTGTIMRTVFDARARQVSRWVGTNDTPPSGDWSPGNNLSPANMTQTNQNTFDGGGVGNDLLTQRSVFTGVSSSLTTTYQYDYRNRESQRTVPEGVTLVPTRDNLNRPIRVQMLNAGVLRSQDETSYDAKGKIFRKKTFHVDPVSGALGNHLTSNFWFNGRGLLVKTRGPNGEFQKVNYDGLQRTVANFISFDDSETVYGDASQVTNDVVIEQIVTAYDAASNKIQVTTYRRTPAATQMGDLSAGWTVAQSRRSFVAQWFDLANRITAFVDYGTNNGTSLSRPTNPPAIPSSDTTYTILEKRFAYDAGGRQNLVTNNKNRDFQTTYDGLGRVTKVAENFVNGVAAATENDQDRITVLSYDTMSRLSKRTAFNPKGTGQGVEQQVTTYVYGTTANQSTPAVYRNDLLVAEIYPDSDDVYDPLAPAGSQLGNGPDGAYDRIEYTYEYSSRRSTVKDPRGVLRTTVYDAAGRVSAEAATNLPGTVDGSVLRLGKSYDALSRLEFQTSYSDVAGALIVNQVKYSYDGWGNKIKSEQSHAGPVVGGTTPSYQETIADGAAGPEAKYARPVSMTYPNGRVVFMNYPASGMGEKISRIDNLSSAAVGGTVYAQYSYLGTRGFLDTAHPGVTGGLTLRVGTDGNPAAWDRFDQILDTNWTDGAGTTSLDRYQYGLDRTGNRRYRDVVPTNPPLGRDEFTVYDKLDRPENSKQGNLNGTKSGISGTAAAENQYTLEALGNFRKLVQKANGTTTLNQTRSHNRANEIDVDNNDANAAGNSIAATVGVDWNNPAYDKAGNLTAAPIPGAEGGAAYHVLTYDAWNRLITVTPQNTPGALVPTYRYDAAGRRISKSVLNTGTSTIARTDYYYTCEWQCVEERSGTGGGVATIAAVQWVWDLRYIDAAVVRFRNADASPDGSLEETLYYTQDSGFNTTALVSASGVVVERYTYDLYGKVTTLSATWTTQAPSFANDILYGGYRFDPETGLYHVRRRAYHPTLGRWVQRDPEKYPDGMNLYAPYFIPRVTDPFGLDIKGEEGFVKGLKDTSPDLAKVTTALFENADFKKMWDCVKNDKNATLTVASEPGLGKADGKERFGRWNKDFGANSGTLRINPTKKEHVDNPQEVVDTIVHELIHALLDIAPDCLPKGVSDWYHDPKRVGIGPPTKSDINDKELRKYLDENYGPGASDPENEWLDENAEAQDLIKKIIEDNLKKTEKGKKTLTFDCEEARKKAKEENKKSQDKDKKPEDKK